MSGGLLAVEEIRAGYGDAVVLDDISFEVPEHGSLAVLGRNGVGKSTLLLSIMGYTQVSRGRVLWRGVDMTATQPHRRARSGPGLGRARARDLPLPDGRGEPDGGFAAGPLGPAGRLRPVSAPCRAAC